MNYRLAVIGVGNMAKAVISGIQKSDVCVSEIFLFDKNESQYEDLCEGRCSYVRCNSISSAVESSDCVLLSVKPQNYADVLKEISAVNGHDTKLYITIGAGITVKTVSDALNTADVVRVLPNIPMTIEKGVSVICRNNNVSSDDFNFVCSLFNAAGSTLLIDENEMNRIIGVTSSSPAYVFKFIDSIYKGALMQGLSSEGLMDAICDVFIGSALLLKNSTETAEELIARVASKGGTTEQALKKLDESNVSGIIANAMIACTQRAEELGQTK